METRDKGDTRSCGKCSETLHENVYSYKRHCRRQQTTLRSIDANDELIETLACNSKIIFVL